MNKQQPARLTLDTEKEYFWCSCGKSEKDPFCNGAHKAEGVKAPVKFKPKNEEVALCTCKKTKTPPYCDGSHKE